MNTGDLGRHMEIYTEMATDDVWVNHQIVFNRAEGGTELNKLFTILSSNV